MTGMKEVLGLKNIHIYLNWEVSMHVVVPIGTRIINMAHVFPHFSPWGRF
jgi:hypothetical protein